MAVAQRMTAEEFIAMPEPLNRRPWNLVDGVVVMNDPTLLHGHAQRAIFRALDAWTLASPGRGVVPWPCDVQPNEDNVYVPDVLWYRSGREPDESQPPPYPLPDLAVEVRLPSTWRHDVGRKRAVYEAAGLPELWLVDTASASVLVHRRSRPEQALFDVALELGLGDELRSPLLPELALAVDSVFPAS